MSGHGAHSGPSMSTRRAETRAGAVAAGAMATGCRGWTRHRHKPAPQAWAVILSLESNSFAEFFPWSFSRIESDGIVFSQVRGNYYYKEQSARPARPVYRTPNSGCCVYRVLSTHATSSDEAPPTLAA